MYDLLRALCVATSAIAPLAVASAGEIVPYVRTTFSDIRAAHVGRPLVVHFWSVTCLPCLVEMPRLARLVRERNDLDLVLVATDPIEEKERIASQLARFGFQDVASFAFADAFAEKLRFEADRKWRGELPFTVMIGADGGVTARAGSLETDELDNWRGKQN